MIIDKPQSNSLKDISKSFLKFLEECGVAILSIQGVYVRNGEVVNVSQLRG